MSQLIQSNKSFYETMKKYANKLLEIFNKNNVKDEEIKNAINNLLDELDELRIFVKKIINN
ncbi:hypothetical protein BCF59_0257 [Mycoplasmopsis mustelae]|uniref:Uncharacterized protein n=1 Tax=Mycoplasmopsis mustelae TaxID=171289 RepID=A0A4R7UCX1_9BACT|nr:hypothetical protein [Mycoplasmopsis mustelae]TDV24298.1 hypothetical protein BCF59_0257 [Mycoplasmopsis mustelae]